MKPRPLHVGKLVPPPYAGIEAHIDTLLRSLIPDAEGTLVACEGRRPVGLGVRLPYRVIAARTIGTAASVALSPDILFKVRKEIRYGSCNLLHAHAPNPWGDFASLWCSPRVPVVLTWHSDIVRQRTLLKAYRTIQRRVLERVDKIIVFTPKHYDSSEQLKEVSVDNKIVTIPLGIDFSRLDQTAEYAPARESIEMFCAGRPVVLTVGRHVYYKGYEYLLSAFARVRSDAVLLLIGTGPLSETLQRQARDLRLQNRVKFLGEVDEQTLVWALHRCNFFCLPSVARSEAFGIASAEAMACGKATIVCHLDNGVNYLNRDGITSLTVPPRDVPALADAIDILVIDDALRERFGKAARRWVRSTFGIVAMREATLNLYRSLL